MGWGYQCWSNIYEYWQILDYPILLYKQFITINYTTFRLFIISAIQWRIIDFVPAWRILICDNCVLEIQLNWTLSLAPARLSCSKILHISRHFRRPSDNDNDPPPPSSCQSSTHKEKPHAWHKTDMVVKWVPRWADVSAYRWPWVLTCCLSWCINICMHIHIYIYIFIYLQIDVHITLY